MGYLQNIKSVEIYVKMMRAMLFRMPKAERDEACEEVSQHLEALVEDFQAEGYLPQESLTRAIGRFGPPFKVGRKIAQKWEAKRQRLLQATNPRLARQEKWLRYIYAIIGTGMPILLVTNYHSWSVILVGASVHGFLINTLLPYKWHFEAQTTEAGGFDRSEFWKEKLSQIDAQLLQSKSFQRRLNLRVARWCGKWAVNREQTVSTIPSNWKWKLVWKICGLVYLTVLVLWPAGGQLTNLKLMLIFLYISGNVASVSRNLANKIFLTGKKS